LLATLVTPHLAHDWEAGRREQVAARLRMILKLFALTFTAAGVVLVIASPLFFHAALQDKFGFGQSIFPFTLACTVWSGLAWISHNWLWCAERSRLVCLGIVVGLATNVGLNLVLLPRYGLEGVVWAAAISRVTILILDWVMCRLLGMRIDVGLAVVAALPALLLIGPWWTLAGTAVALCGFVPMLSVFDVDERRQLRELGRAKWQRFQPLLPGRRGQAPLVPHTAGK
jgi:O-antigen/teichoic acid export membrane protein